MPEAAIQHKLQALFAEATALAHQLRKMTGKAHYPDGCSAGVLSLLRILDQQGPQTVPAVARARVLSRQNVQVLVNRLRDRGLVTLAANPAHRRSALICLTDPARALLAAVSRQELQSTEALLPHIPETRLLPTATLLRELRQLLCGSQLVEAPSLPEFSTPPRAAAPPRLPRRKRPSPVATETPPPQPGDSEESEFPVNLL